MYVGSVWRANHGTGNAQSLVIEERFLLLNFIFFANVFHIVLLTREQGGHIVLSIERSNVSVKSRNCGNMCFFHLEETEVA